MFSYVIQIGDGRHGNSAVSCKSPYGNILSHNQVSFWYTSKYADLRFTLGKETDQGKEVARLIEENADLDTLQDYLESLIFKFTNPDQIKAALLGTIERAYQRGRSEKAR